MLPISAVPPIRAQSAPAAEPTEARLTQSDVRQYRIPSALPWAIFAMAVAISAAFSIALSLRSPAWPVTLSTNFALCGLSIALSLLAWARHDDRARATLSDNTLAERNQQLENEIVERLRAESKQTERSNELARMLEISNTLTSTLEIGALLTLILRKLREVVDYDEALIAEFIGPGNFDAHIISCAGFAPPVDPAGKIWRYDRDTDASVSRMIESVQTILLLNLDSTDEYTRSFRDWYVRNQLTHGAPMCAALLAPMIIKNQIIGMLVLRTSRRGYYTPRLADLALALASQAAVAVENARMHIGAVRAAAVNERTRLARELHDSVSQSLFGIVLGARTALASADPATAHEAMNYVLKLAEDGLTEMRALIFELRPEQLAADGLRAALKRQIGALCQRHNLRLEVDMSEHEPDLSLDVKEALYRIALESANNAIKHAGGGCMRLKLRETVDLLVMEVADDGCGFDPYGQFDGHLGLRSMHERAAQLGATLMIESAPGKGTRVRLHLIQTQ